VQRLWNQIQEWSSSLRYQHVFLLVILLVSCHPARKLQPGQYLLDDVKVLNTRETKIQKEEFESFFRQRPNRKLFRAFHFFVWWYNLFDPQKIAAKKVARNERYDRINARKIKHAEEKNKKRAKQGKKPRTPKLKNKESPVFLEYLRDVGEPPVIFDSILTATTRNQLNRFLFSKGFFNNHVDDSVIISEKNKKAVVNYVLRPGAPYLINKVTLSAQDTALGAFMQDTLFTILKQGMRYDAARLQEARQRLTDHALNNGYYYFENAYIAFDVDSAYGNHTVSVNVILKKFGKPYSSDNDSMVYVNHPKLRVKNVYVITEPVIGNIRDAAFRDTVHAKKATVMFLLNRPLPYKESLLISNIDIKSGNLFRRDTATQTYRQLLGLGVFKNVTIQFIVNGDERNMLDCFIICSPLIRQSITIEPQLTHTSGNFGADASFVYQNRNLLRGGELLELRMQAALIAQSQFNTKGEQQNKLENLSAFNTFQFGPQLTFSVPRAFFPFSLLRFKREMSPRTYVKSSYNVQSRDIFNREIASIDYGFNFRTHNGTIRHDLTPVEIYLVKARLSTEFRNSLFSSNDAFLINSFQDHVTTLSRYSFSYLTKENTNASRKPVSYLRWTIASSGSLLRQYFEESSESADTLGRYLLFGIPFAHFIRTDIDYRLYLPIRKKSRVVYRIAGGIGKPLENLSVLPYEQSFFSGGPNSVRAWRARTLGPGSYDPSLSATRFDKIGDILIEGNFEYRFHVIKDFNGALFVDAGNIWRLYPDETKPGGEFYVDRFLDQIAIGGGFGVRWDLNFFVLRFDFAAPLKDPALDVKNRWTFINQPTEVQPWNRIVVNFGIGYPF
jgi:outer membrane protein assembly factor BamA